MLACPVPEDSRPQLDAMMRLAKTRKLDVIAVWKLDRFGRSLRHLVDTLEELKAVGCNFVSPGILTDRRRPASTAVGGHSGKS